jgi:hypothetical protein
MSDSATISKKQPDSNSRFFAFLREVAIKYIQSLAGKIWTDYNAHDPGVTTLEVLSYAITELGYRADYEIEDILALDPDDPNAVDIKNFFTAREILPNSPVTVNDYRKLLIDIDIYEPGNPDCEHVGVKNAWIEKSTTNELPVYVHKKDSLLDHDPDPLWTPSGDETSQSPLEIGILYDILLEFEKCDAFGDLNENSITKSFTIEEHTPDTNLNGLEITIAVEFPRWDNTDVSWDDPLSVKSEIHKITIRFSNYPGNYEFSYVLVNNVVKLTGTETTASDVVGILGIQDIEDEINDFIYYDTDSLLQSYLQKIGKIEEIIEAVKARLHANRNLCEDFYKLSALKVEKIAVCADIELEQDANIEEVQAYIYHEIAKFLSPTVNFYSLQEMLDKCKIKYEYDIEAIDKTNKGFTVEGDLEELLAEGDTVTIAGSRSNDGDYTVKSLLADDDSGKTKITVDEDIFSDLLTEGESLAFYITDEDECLTVDEIFEGPALDHGFIDDEELEIADRKKYIHVSDLIRIIMNIEGVVAVKSIQIANIPQDNEDGAIPSKSVKWCLDLAFEQNYVPRLSIIDSKITYYKDQLPFRASSSIVEDLIDALEDAERTPKLFNPQLDFEVPEGTYTDLEDYESIQNEFPIAYGIGEEGLSTTGYDEDELRFRRAQAKQLKGYLMVFDQLLANFFSQLAHVKDLFSINAEKDSLGNYIIGRTYYTQPLFDIVPDADELYVDKGGHVVALNNIAEDEELFNVRKNKFLDHLLGRFAEQFTDYALLTFKISGELKAPAELIEDKLAFLNAYPTISSARSKGFNHQAPCKLWHVDNISGLRRRASYLAGIDETDPDDLLFSDSFEFITVSDQTQIQVSNTTPTLLLTSAGLYDTLEEAKLALEKMIINGVSKEKYAVDSDDGINYYFTLVCDDEVLAVSERVDYPDGDPGGLLDDTIEELMAIFSNEYYFNLESNRNNLACPVLNYVQYSIALDMEQDPPVAIVSFDLFASSMTYNPADRLLTGQFEVQGEAKSEVDIISVDNTLKQIVIDGNIADKLETGDVLTIEDSQDNDGVYTVVSAADNGPNTDIIVNEAIPSNTTPLGELLYNNDTPAGLERKAQSQIPDLLWQLLDNGQNENSYYFSTDSGSYRFRIIGSGGTDIAESIDDDFNDALATEITNLTSGSITITGSTDNDGVYTVVSAAAAEDEVTITVSPNLVSTTADGSLSFTESFGYSVNLENNMLIVESDLTGVLFVGNTIEIGGSESNDGLYTILSIKLNGADTEIIVKQAIPSEDNSGNLLYTKSFGIKVAATDTLTVNGGYDNKAVDDMISFMRAKFFSHEGFHILEHVLVRPKVKGLHYVDADEETLTEGLAANGSFYFMKTLPLFSASSENDWFKVAGNVSSEIDRFPSTHLSSDIRISETGANDSWYAVSGVQYDGGNDRTSIFTHEDVPVRIPPNGFVGNLSYFKGTPITSLTASALSIEINDPESLGLLKGDEVEIRGSDDGLNDGKYTVEELIDHTTHQEVILSQVMMHVEDDLLEIVLDEDEECDSCQISDPYTCVASVILPHWQGRFDNMDFRRFFEKQLRLEAPAHVFLNICWVSCEQMTAFELKYKTWLAENARKEKDYGRLSASLNELLDIHRRLRNVYPSGTLHDCEEDETLENAIILDNSVLGNA